MSEYTAKSDFSFPLWAFWKTELGIS